jgi:uncharacterized protein
MHGAHAPRHHLLWAPRLRERRGGGVGVDTLVRALVLLSEFALIFLAVSFAVHLLVQSLTPQRLRQAMAGHPVRSTVVALVAGAVTPFCSCSTVPVVAGMVAAGVPVMPLTVFLVLSPLVNPASVALIATLTTPAHAAGFVLLAMGLALVVGAALTALRVTPRMTSAAHDADATAGGPTPLPWRARARRAGQRAWRDGRSVAPLLAAVAAVGAVLHGQVDVRLVSSAIDAAGPWAVPVAVLVGVPIYASTAVLLPLGTLLLASGAHLGVVTAFLIGATGLSVPEGIMLDRLLGRRYLVTLAAAFVIAAVAIGYVLQVALPAAI